MQTIYNQYHLILIFINNILLQNENQLQLLDLKNHISKLELLLLEF